MDPKHYTDLLYLVEYIKITKVSTRGTACVKYDYEGQLGVGTAYIPQSDEFQTEYQT